VHLLREKPESGRERYGKYLTGYAFFFVLTVCCSLPGCARKEPPAVGAEAPKFTLPDLRGEKMTVPDDFIGRVVILRFWVDSCKSCEKEMPEIDYLYKKYKERGLIVLAVNVGQSRDAAAAFMAKLKISYPALLDTNSAITEQYGVKAVPFTFVIDRKGVIRKRILGETERESFEKIIQDIL